MTGQVAYTDYVESEFLLAIIREDTDTASALMADMSLPALVELRNQLGEGREMANREIWKRRDAESRAFRQSTEPTSELLREATGGEGVGDGN